MCNMLLNTQIIVTICWTNVFKMCIFMNILVYIGHGIVSANIGLLEKT